MFIFKRPLTYAYRTGVCGRYDTFVLLWVMCTGILSLSSFGLLCLGLVQQLDLILQLGDVVFDSLGAMFHLTEH